MDTGLSEAPFTSQGSSRSGSTMNAVPDDSAPKNARGRPIRKIVIVGGGTAGWMTAAALSVAMRRQSCQIVLIESDEIGIVGVGEATIPEIREFNRYIGLDENDFVRSTQGSFKLAIQFVDFRRIGHVYFNPLAGLVGGNWAVSSAANTLPPLYQSLLKLAVDGRDPDLHDYSLCSMAARHNRFDRLKGNVTEQGYSYAYQFDASLYAKYLRAHAEERGVERVEGKIVDVQLRADSGFIDAVVLQSGERIEGELFIDCSGFRGLLIEHALNVPYEDWSHWLPCDRAWAVPCESVTPLLPYTRATAREAGWQWRIPLQHRIGNGYVFSSKFISEDKAAETLLANLDRPSLAQPRLLKFTTGRRKEAWAKNCVAVGLSSGFLEPLESTSIHMIQTAIMDLIKFFPTTDFGPRVIEEYNRRADSRYECFRDFIILHYHATEREDSEFWRYCRHMSVPDSLLFNEEIFRSHGHITSIPPHGFGPRAWFTVMYSQGIVPQSCPPLAETPDDHALRVEMAKLRVGIKRAVEQMPSHEQFISSNCSALAGAA